jgi:phosphatidylinositol-3-phosphatase
VSELSRRRDRLAEEVTQLHWDLGGLAYEMAIRDHFRLDVLLRRAALLQERDAELAEVESLLRTESAGAAESCAPSAAESRPPSPEESCPASAAPHAPRLRLPPPSISAVLVLVFVAFGALLGSASGSNVDRTLAASARRPLRLVLPAASATTPVQAPSAGGEAPLAEPPAVEPAETPTAASPARTARGGHSGAGTGAGEGGQGGEGGSGEGGSGETAAGAGAAAKLPAIKHVFVVMLADEPYASVFGPASSARYLAGTLERRGALLVRYDAVAHEELADGLALLSGQGPTAQTAANCPTYSDVVPATPAAHGQVIGSGCVYPPATQTLAGQLAAKHRSWRAYVQGMAEGPGQAPACGHPPLGQADPSSFVPAWPAPAALGAAPAAPVTAGTYATFRNPFVYFHSLIDSPACAAGDVGLDRLNADLATLARTPSLSYIVPDRCHDGSPSPCAPGAAAGMAPADALLRRLVPEITGSRAYREGGLLVITVDEAPAGGELADSSACCGQPPFPNLPAPGATGPTGRGGGTVGALLLSPFITGPQTSQEPYNHFSLLRTIEDVFGLAHLGYAALPAVKPFEASLFSAKAKAKG